MKRHRRLRLALAITALFLAHAGTSWASFGLEQTVVVVQPGRPFYPQALTGDPKGDLVALTAAPGKPVRVEIHSDAGRLLRAWRVESVPGTMADSRDIAVDESGDVYVSDRSTGSVQKFDPEGRLLDGKWAAGSFDSVAADRSGHVYTETDGQIEQRDRAGAVLHTWSGVPGGKLSAAPGHVYELGPDGVSSWSSTGTPGPVLGRTITRDTGVFRDGQYSISGPTSLAATADGLWVSDESGQRMQLFSPDGRVRNVCEAYGATGDFSPGLLGAGPGRELFVLYGGVLEFGPSAWTYSACRRSYEPAPALLQRATLTSRGSGGNRHLVLTLRVSDPATAFGRFQTARRGRWEDLPRCSTLTIRLKRGLSHHTLSRRAGCLWLRPGRYRLVVTVRSGNRRVRARPLALQVR